MQVLPLALLQITERVKRALILLHGMGRPRLLLCQQGWRQPGWLSAFWLGIPLALNTACMMESTAGWQAKPAAVAPSAVAAPAKQLPAVSKSCPREQAGEMLVACAPRGLSTWFLPLACLKRAHSPAPQLPAQHTKHRGRLHPGWWFKETCQGRWQCRCHIWMRRSALLL